MIDFDINFEEFNLKELENFNRKIIDDFETEKPQIVEQIIKNWKSLIKEKTKSDDNSKSITEINYTKTADGYVIYSDFIGAKIWEYGGIIHPIRLEYLTFQITPGRWVRVKEVTIPQRATLKPAMEEVKINGLLEKIMEFL